MKSAEIIGLLTVGVLVIVAFGALMALPVMWLTNAIFSDDITKAFFGTTEIGFLKSWGLLILCGLLFKSNNTNNKKD